MHARTFTLSSHPVRMPDLRAPLERKEQNQSLINTFLQYFPNNVIWGRIPVDTMEPLTHGILTSADPQIIDNMMRQIQARIHIPDGKTAILFISDEYFESIRRQGYLVTIGVNRD